MDDNLKNDYSLLESNQDSFGAKIKEHNKLPIFIIFLTFIVICLIYRGIKSSNPNTITITSKDGTQKMSLMKKDTKYRGPNSCPKGYHIPSAYEWRKVLKLWCENHENCNANGYIGFEFLWYGDSKDTYNTIKDFFQDVNIHLNKHFDFGAGFIKERQLGIKKDNSYCNALEAYDFLNGHASFSVDYYSLVDCDEKPKYVRCFSDENLTTEFINEENFKYSIERTKFEIDGTSYSGRKITGMPRGDIVIPDSFVGIPIIEIGGRMSDNITSIKLGKNIIKIDSYAFARSNGIGMKEIEIPDSVLYIGEDAFLNNKLTSVKFSDNLLYIGKSAFGNNQITSIKLPDTVRFMGAGAFYQNKILSFHIPRGIKEISPEILRNNNLESIIIPEGVEVIGDLAFYGNDLTEVSLPQSLKTIGKQAFSCNNLTNVILPESVETIGKAAFCGNEKGRNPDFKGGFCGENGFVVVKGYPKDNEACININPFKSCRDEEENGVCGKNGWGYRNTCQMKANGDEENPKYEYIDGKCVLKKD